MGGGAVGAAAGSNPEYRHDMVYKSRNPQTRGSAGAYAMIAALRQPGRSSSEFKGAKKPKGSGKAMTGKSY